MLITPQNIKEQKGEAYHYTDLAAITRGLAWHSEELSDLNISSTEGPVVIEDSIGVTAGVCLSRAQRVRVCERGKLLFIHTVTGAGALIDSIEINVERGAQVRLIHLHTGPVSSRTAITVNMRGDGAEFTLNGAQILTSGQHGDITVNVRHKAASATSRQSVCSIVGANARGVFQGKTTVEPGAIGTDAHQISRAILLSSLAEMDARPELEIYADDVKCSHGATTGALDEDQIFYLTARGIDQKTARAILLRAFVADLFTGLDDRMEENLLRLVDTALTQEAS